MQRLIVEAKKRAEELKKMQEQKKKESIVNPRNFSMPEKTR